MNRWKTVERAKGKQPQWNMVDNYSDARDLMPVTWRYSHMFNRGGERQPNQASQGWTSKTMEHLYNGA
jgi:hypothetical protein